MIGPNLVRRYEAPSVKRRLRASQKSMIRPMISKTVTKSMIARCVSSFGDTGREIQIILILSYLVKDSKSSLPRKATFRHHFGVVWLVSGS